jgi:hypothetical protein
MPLITSIDEEAGLATHTITGELSLEEVMQAMVTLFTSPKFRPDMAILVDISCGSAKTLSQEDIDEFVNLTRAMGEKRGSGRSAILAAKDLDYGIGRIIQALLDDTPRALRVFRDRDVAIHWLLEKSDSPTPQSE